MDSKYSADTYTDYFLENQSMAKEEEYTCYLCNASYEKGTKFVSILSQIAQSSRFDWVLIIPTMNFPRILSEFAIFMAIFTSFNHPVMKFDILKFIN